jgi:serine/threonine protein kinase
MSSELIARAICRELEYQFMRKVGKGAYKDTYEILGNNKESEALKVFKEGHSAKRSDREIEAMIKCDHHNIGKLRYVSRYTHRGKKYLFTIEEFLSGGTLKQRLKKSLLSAETTRIVGSQLISAIAHIADKDLVHRDIKPDNVMFRKDCITPVIVDFGLVRNLVDKSLTHTCFIQGPGSPYFSSPEQLNNDKELIDWRTDQFALGILLSISHFGLHPYAGKGDTTDDVIDRVSQREALSNEFTVKAKESKLDVIAKMVAPWPVERFRTPENLAGAWSKAFQ